MVEIFLEKPFPDITWEQLRKLTDPKVKPENIGPGVINNVQLGDTVTFSTTNINVQNIARRYIQIEVFSPTSPVTTGDGKKYVHIPTNLNGLNLVEVHAEVVSSGTTNTTDIQIHNVTDSVDMLSTKLTIDSGETGSDTATAAVINTSNDKIETNDVLRIDIDQVSTTPPDGLLVTMGFE